MMYKKYFIFLALIVLSASFNFPKSAIAQSATLYFSPSSGAFSQGESFWVSVMVNTDGNAINAIAAYFTYPEDKLEPLGVNTAGSPFTIWAEKNVAGGKVDISGGLPTPGFSGIEKIASVGFRAKVSSGSSDFKFSQDSAVITDADNKNILNLASSGQGSYSFKAKSQAVQPIPAVEEPKAPVISEAKVDNITQQQFPPASPKLPIVFIVLTVVFSALAIYLIVKIWKFKSS